MTYARLKRCHLYLVIEVYAMFSYLTYCDSGKLTGSWRAGENEGKFKHRGHDISTKQVHVHPKLLL